MRPCVNYFRSRDKVHIFYPIILKLAQIVCIIVRLNPIEKQKKSDEHSHRASVHPFVRALTIFRSREVHILIRLF